MILWSRVQPSSRRFQIGVVVVAVVVAAVGVGVGVVDSSKTLLQFRNSLDTCSLICETGFPNSHIFISSHLEEEVVEATSISVSDVAETGDIATAATVTIAIAGVVAFAVATAATGAGKQQPPPSCSSNLNIHFTTML